MARTIKEEMIDGGGRVTHNGGAEDTTVKRRVLRSKYHMLKNRLSDERDDMSKVDSDKFKSMIEEVDSLHLLVQKPREQVADAEALFDIANTLVTTVKAYNNEGLTPSDLISCLLTNFGEGVGPSSSQNEARTLIRWADIGKVVSHVFRGAPFCRTMVGPMSTELKQRKNVVHRKRAKLEENKRPEELGETANKEKTDTDKNMATMFGILRKNRKVKLEHLILNRESFAQTVENLFALSFLIKDGRAEMSVDDAGCHLVSPRNSPSASAIQSGDVTYCHFVFRFDFKDWKSMLDSVAVGEELMPHRIVDEEAIHAMPDPEPEEDQLSQPIRKFSRNRGLVKHEQAVAADSPESDDAAASKAAAIRRGKRKVT